MNKTNLPNNLYELRRKSGLSQEEFADRLCVSRQAVSKWERGEAYPDTENLIAISEMFSVTIDDLLKSTSIETDYEENTAEKETESESDKSADNEYFRVHVGDKAKVDLNGGITFNDKDGTVKVDFNDSGITVNDEDGTVKVDFGNDGITVNGEDGVKVKLGRGGIVIHDNDDEEDDDDED